MLPQDLIAELGKTLGLPLSLENGVCRVIFDADAVDFEASGETLFAMAELGPAAGRPDACERFMRANFAGQETGGAVLGIHDGSFMLHMAFPEGTSGARFEAGVTALVKALRYWKEWLQLPPQIETPAEPASDPLLNTMIRI